jgi:hypothetical protein
LAPLKRFKHYLVYSLALLLCTACASTKTKLKKTTDIQRDSVFFKRDSIQIKTINKSIHDVIFLPLETGDKKVDSVISKKLNHFKTYKKSGDNSYKITYNKTNKGFEITSKIGATENTLVQRKDSIKSSKKHSVTIENTKVIIKYRIPGWFLMVFGISILIVYLFARFRVF